MNMRSVLAGLSLVAGLGFAAPMASAEDCQCNCYFSGDCESGNFCNWGNLSIEDSCWWRRPKPQGSPGAGCDEDYGDWGQCDGICSSTSAARTIVGGETLKVLTEGVTMWTRALNATSLDGGGRVSEEWLRRIDELEFSNPTMAYGLWRMTVEMLMYGRGLDYLTFPEEGSYQLYEVEVADLKGQDRIMRNGNLVVQSLLAELHESGSGLRILMDLDESVLDMKLLGDVCDNYDSEEFHLCLHERIVDMAIVLTSSQEADRGEEGSGPSCGGCYGDCVPDDAVNTGDLLDILANWGSSDFPASDLDNSGMVDVTDLLGALGAWGVCVE